MENNNAKFRLRLNLFDGIVLAVVLLVGAFFVWRALDATTVRPDANPEITINYTIRFNSSLIGTSELLMEGDDLYDSMNSDHLGQVVAATSGTATQLVLNQETGVRVKAVIPDREAVIICLTTKGTETDMGIFLTSGRQILVGQPLYIRGPGYVGSGNIIAIDREV